MLEKIDKRLDFCLSFTAALETMAPHFIISRKNVPMSLYVHQEEMGFNFYINSPNKEEIELLRFHDPIRLGTLSMITQSVDLQVLRMFYSVVRSLREAVKLQCFSVETHELPSTESLISPRE